MNIRLIKDSCGDLPPSLVGQKAKIISRNKLHDEMGIKAYNVKFFSRKYKIHVLWEDEFIYLKKASR